VQADDPAVLMYTSGTSGLPKGVVLTYGNLQSDVDASIEHAVLLKKYRFLGVIPLFHAFGMTAMMLAPIQLGTMVVYIARFSPAAALNAIRQHKVSIMFGVPSMYNAMLHLKGATAADFAGFFALISGGEPLPEKVRKEFESRFGVTIYEGYGLTESSPVVALNVPRKFRPGSVGTPLPGMQMRIVDEQGNVLPAGREGEIWFRGPMVMKQYFNLPTETAAAITPDGFFKTGDLGHFDADGFLHLTGRKKDLIIVAGEKVVPREVEETLQRHPDVAEVAVVGKKDASRGEMVVAFVIPNEGCSPTPESLREFCRQQPLAAFKAPREVYIVNDFPRSATGKVIKRILAEKLNS
jgi:long-chain acyl-CoA synthetase